jgi:predicted permease
MRIPTLLTRLRGLFRPGRVASEIDEEMGLHVTMRAHDLERGGMAPGEARRAAARRFGNVPLLRDHGLDVRGGGLPGTLVQDVRFGVRLLRRQPVSSLLAVATLAVGIGMSTMLFSVVDVALLRPLPYPDPEELVLLSIEEHEIDGDVQRTDPSIRDVRGWRDAPHVLAAVGIGSDYALRRVVDAPAFEAAERVPVGEACEGFIEVLGIAPLLGRAINAEDCRLGAPAVALLGEAYWRRQFGASPDIIGRSVQLAGTSATIVGVLPAGLQPEAAVWSPPAFQANESNWDVRRGMGLTVRARLAPGVTAAQAARELTELTARLGDDDGSRPAGRVYVQSMHEEAVAGSAASLSVLGGAVALILLIACVNVAGLLLARGVTRQSELAIRVSIGASRARLVRQLVTECLMLGGLGAVAGLALAAISLDAFVSLVPLALPENSPLGLGVTVVAAAVALGMTSAVAAGVVPALRLSRVRPGVDLASASRLHGAALSRRGGKCLIAVEVALAIVLLAGAGVLVQSFVRLVSVDLGFDPDGIVTMEVQLASAEPDVGGLYYTELLDRLRALPDVESASGAWGMLGDMAAITFGVPGLVRPGEFDTVTPVDLFPVHGAAGVLRNPGRRHHSGPGLERRRPRQGRGGDQRGSAPTDVPGRLSGRSLTHYDRR